MSRSPRVFRVGAIFTRSRGAAKLIRKSALCSEGNRSTISLEFRPDSQASQWIQPCGSLLDFRHTQGENFVPAIGI